MKYTCLNIQGNLISEDILQKIEEGVAEGQKPADFQLNSAANLREEMEYAWSRVKLDWSHFQDRADKLPDHDRFGTTLARKWMLQFFDTMGLDLQLQRTVVTGDNGQTYNISHSAVNLDELPVDIVGFVDPDPGKERNTLDLKSVGNRNRSSHGMVQEYLNVTEHLYGLCANGYMLRLIRDSGRLVKLTYLEFDLKRMLEEDKYSEFTLLFRLLHATRFPKSKAEADQCLLEKYYQSSIETGNRIRDGLSQAVRESLVALGNGLLNQPENTALREAYQNGQLSAYELNHELLRLIYRLLFLIVTEERDLVFDNQSSSETQKRNKDLYYRFYSLARLRKLSGNRYIFEPQFTDLWQGLLQTFSFFEPGNRGVKLGIHPLGGELFQPAAIKNIGGALINNQVLLQCIRSLNEFEDAQKNRVLINFRALDVEELGSIYEGLLELAPVITYDGNTYHYSYEKGNERSSSGSHYTPEDLVKPLIQHSLEYLIQDRVDPYYKGKKTAEEAIQDLLKLKVADVACGSGHILLSAARRIAHEVARIESGEQQPNPQSFRKALKEVIRHCIYGVDKNPLAVELCKVALWLESHNPGEPLNFLDHHIKCGDAIVGLAHRSELEKGIADEAFKTLPGDEKEIAQSFAKRNKEERKRVAAKNAAQQLTTEQQVENTVQEAMAEYGEFARLPETTPEEIERKARAYQKFIDGKGFTFLKAMADTQVAQFFIPKTDANKETLMTDADFRLILSGYKGWQDRKVAKATAVAHEQRFFHWFIEFPEVFAEGGFDCVLGNPPYLGGKKISTYYGFRYTLILKTNYLSESSCDLVVYFFHRILNVLNSEGFMSLITTNSISEAGNRTDGLQKIESQSTINMAATNVIWPGNADVTVTLISITRRKQFNSILLNNEKTNYISSHLNSSEYLMEPFPLRNSSDIASIGVYPNGDFVVDAEEYHKIISSHPAEINLLRRYLNGQELNNQIDSKTTKYIIDLNSFSEEEVRSYYSFELLESRVKPYRDQLIIKGGQIHELDFWRFWDKRPDLMKKLNILETCFVMTRVSKYFIIQEVETDQVLSDALVVFASNDVNLFIQLQASFHEYWSWHYCSTMRNFGLRYTPRNSADKYPFINDKIIFRSDFYTAFKNLRSDLMNKYSVGLTGVYNLFHSNTSDQLGDILILRQLHIELDNMILNAYGWSDIQLRHDFYEVDYLPENDRIRFTIHPDARKEVLKRLLELNHKIYEEEIQQGLRKYEDVVKFYQQKNQPIPYEVQLLYEKKKKSKKKGNEVNEGQVGYGGLL